MPIFQYVDRMFCALKQGGDNSFLLLQMLILQTHVKGKGLFFYYIKMYN